MNPIRLSELFSKGWRAYKADFGLLLAITIGLELPSAVEVILRKRYPTEDVSWIDLLSLVSFFVIMIGTIGLVGAIYARRKGGPVGLSEAFSIGRGRWGRYTLGFFVYGVIVLVGALLLVIPGVYCLVIFSLAYLCILVDDMGIRDSFARSKELLRGTFWIVFAVQAFGVLATVPWDIVAAFGESGRTSLVLQLFSIAVTTLVTPLVVAIEIELYEALKVREGTAS